MSNNEMRGYLTLDPKGVAPRLLWKSVIASVFCLAGSAAVAVETFTLDNFTGDDAQMYVTVVNATSPGTGVVINTGFTSSSTNTGDITGFWIGIDDDSFDPASISLPNITLTGLPSGVTYTVTTGTALQLLDLGNGVNLSGESALVLDFDLDFGLKQNDEQQNDLITSLTINISTGGLLETHFNAFGARLQSVGDNRQGSSKLISNYQGEEPPPSGGGSVPIPAPLALLGLGGLMLGWITRKSRA